MSSGAGGSLAITSLFRKETAVLRTPPPPQKKKKKKKEEEEKEPASVLVYAETNLKQIEAQRTRAESTHKGVN